MSKYTFMCEYTDLHGKVNGDKIIYETTQETLSSVLESFEQFLRGAGFYFNGNLDFVSDDEFVNPVDNSFTYNGETISDEEEPQLDEPHEWILDKAADQEFPSGYKMQMPGTIGGAAVTFRPVTSLDEKCNICNLTRQQLGDHACYDTRCGFKL